MDPSNPAARRRRSRSRAVPIGMLAAGALALTGGAAVADPGVTPGSHSAAVAPGESMVITKTVETPPIPPNPDILFLADTTGSMWSPIENVVSNAASILSQIEAAQPTAEFAVAEYKNEGYDGGGSHFILGQQLTDDTTAAKIAIDGWSPVRGGGDEDWIGALGTVPSEIDFRPGGTPIVVMFGDAPSQDPSAGFTLASATSALQAAGIQVIAIAVDTQEMGLDSKGQASHVTTNTGGTLVPADPDQVADTILAELENLPAQVTHSATCDTGVSATITPASQTVTSGDSATFSETITLANDAPQGETVSCEAEFLVNGALPGPEFVQSVDIDVLDVTLPEGGCEESENPGGKVPKAGKTRPNPQGQNQDGFYAATAVDNVDPAPAVYVRDAGSGHVFGPYDDGQEFKYTESASGPTEKTLGGPGSGILHLIGTGDAEVYAEDASGNVSDPVACLVPAPPK